MAVLAGALALAGCGRKGGLDLPPSAAGAAAANTDEPAEPASLGATIAPSRGNKRELPPPPSPKRPLPIDVLLN
jgi:predicted small lipoprotein YifL